MATLIEGSLVKLARTFEEHGRGPDWVQALNSSGVGADLAEHCPNPHRVDRNSLRRMLVGEKPGFVNFTPDPALLTPVGTTIKIPAIKVLKADPFAQKNEDPKSPFGYRDLGGTTLVQFKRVAAATAKPYRLAKPATSNEMIAAVGGEEVIKQKHLFAPRQIRHLVDKQGSGESGPLLANGWANFFFVLASDGQSLAVVDVVWVSGVCSWHVWARPVSSPSWRRDGYRLFLRT